MKKWIFIFIILLSSFAFANTEEPNAVAIIRDLQNSIRQLNVQVADLVKMVEMQRQEIARLKKLCADAGVEITPHPHRQKVKPPEPPQEKTGQISQPIFGIYLGQSLDKLRSKMKVSKSNYVFTDKNFNGRVWIVKTKEPAIKKLLVCTFNNQIYEIDIEYKDASAENCRTIKQQLERDYKIVSRDKYEQMLGKNTFEAVIDDVKIGIVLNYYSDGDKENRLTVTYVHIPLLEQMQIAPKK